MDVKLQKYLNTDNPSSLNFQELKQAVKMFGTKVPNNVKKVELISMFAAAKQNYDPSRPIDYSESSVASKNRGRNQSDTSITGDADPPKFGQLNDKTQEVDFAPKGNPFDNRRGVGNEDLTQTAFQITGIISNEQIHSQLKNEKKTLNQDVSPQKNLRAFKGVERTPLQADPINQEVDLKQFLGASVYQPGASVINSQKLKFDSQAVVNSVVDLDQQIKMQDKDIQRLIEKSKKVDDKKSVNFADNVKGGSPDLFQKYESNRVDSQVKSKIQPKSVVFQPQTQKQLQQQIPTTQQQNIVKGSQSNELSLDDLNFQVKAQTNIQNPIKQKEPKIELTQPVQKAKQNQPVKKISPKAQMPKHVLIMDETSESSIEYLQKGLFYGKIGLLVTIVVTFLCFCLNISFGQRLIPIVGSVYAGLLNFILPTNFQTESKGWGLNESVDKYYDNDTGKCADGYSLVYNDGIHKNSNTILKLNNMLVRFRKQIAQIYSLAHKEDEYTTYTLKPMLFKHQRCIIANKQINYIHNQLDQLSFDIRKQAGQHICLNIKNLTKNKVSLNNIGHALAFKIEDFTKNQSLIQFVESDDKLEQAIPTSLIYKDKHFYYTADNPVFTWVCRQKIQLHMSFFSYIRKILTNLLISLSIIGGSFYLYVQIQTYRYSNKALQYLKEFKQQNLDRNSKKIALGSLVLREELVCNGLVWQLVERRLRRNPRIKQQMERTGQYQVGIAFYYAGVINGVADVSFSAVGGFSERDSSHSLDI